MRVLVTGGLGFIGWEVVCQAAEAGHDVRVVDDCSGNVVDPVDASVDVWPARLQDLGHAWIGLDAVVHCASPVGAAGVLGRDCVTEITTATAAAIRLAVAAGCPLVNVSTSEVYGVEGVNAEDAACVIPPRHTDRVGYAVGKLAAEHQVAHACRVDGLRAVTVRPFNVVGPLQAAGKGFVLPRLCGQAWAGGPLTVFGDGRQERAFTHVSDVARFLLAAASMPGVMDGRVVNVGAEGNRASIIELARMVAGEVHAAGGPLATVTHVDGRDVFGPAWEEAAAGTKLPDASHAHALGWEPRIGLPGIVRESVLHHAPAHATTEVAA